MSLPYYPMYPRDFFEGTQTMSLEQKGAYIMVLNLIYTRNGPISDEAGYISRYVGCSVRKWKQLRDELIALRKLIVEDGMIRNSRADEVIEKRRSYQDQQSENRARPNKNKAHESPPRTTRAKPKPETEPVSPDADASEVKPHFIAADWKPSPETMAWALNEFRTPSGDALTESEVRNEADSFVDYWLGRRDAKAKRPGWDRTFRGRLREQAAKIVRTRPRANGTAPAGRPASAPQFAPNITLFDAFAVAGAKASSVGQGPQRGPGVGDAFGEPRRSAGVEILDRGDPRGAEARRAGSDFSDASPAVVPLPAAAVR